MSGVQALINFIGKLSDLTNNSLKTSIVGSLANIPTELASGLDKDIDSFDLAKMSNGGLASTGLNGITATTISNEIPVGAAGFKHVAIYLEGSAFTSGNFAFTLEGASILGGNYGSIYKQKDDGTFSAALTIPAISTNANLCYVLPNIGVNYLKITATRTTNGTLTVRAIPFN